ncbi:phage DNA ejection protein [Arsenophonus nasoniae]|uniref:DNA/protein translocase of phage P22 injectosome n=2 Tax=Arsenophonus nasoniae TaxID=638 RepID=A0A4P7KVD3_9GAMM|nr:phage DNA ejection protein [Arsenophonus nasoniae]QBY44125.1 DNA/protein translocase of phage P22 injectosome [Arsenophonus nasoniae]WGM04452.1 phage DNA ejection protein [Arsenophonus nasoniae]WGM09530.1 phage DNA ejection protein [Arsenophonus nasoniae]WGM14251.1 phage DNA ejection protein [Arsenophonus nasoniae]
MATFQLAGLPSLQVANQTAGGLGLPTVPQYAEKPNTGLMIANGIGGLVDAFQAADKQKSEADFMKSFGQAYAANDRDAMKQLAIAHPEQIERIQKGMGFIDQNRNQVIGQAAMDLRLAAKSGDQSLMSSLQKNAPILNQMGLSPEEAFLSFKQDPKQFDQITDLIGMHALGPEKYFDIQDKIEGRDIDRNKLAETERSNRASESLTQRGQNISAQNAALDREIKRAELASKSLDRQAQKETDDLRRQELEQKIEANKQKLNEAKEKKNQTQTQAKLALDNGVQQLDRLAQEAKAIRDNPSLWRTTGVPGRFYNFPGSAADDIDAQLESLRSQTGFAVLQAMRDASKTGGALGNVSNFEVQQLQANLGNISGKQSTEAMRKNLNKIINYAEGVKKRVSDAFKRNYPDFKPVETTEINNVDSSNISDDELLNKYLPR